nr:beta-agarase [uncultured bacterium]
MQYDWDNIAIPADAGSGKKWELQSNVSDDFNYTFNATNSKSNFGNGKWYNFNHNKWDGPGTTYWKYNHVSVDGSDLVLKASRYESNNQPNPQYPFPGAWELPHKMVAEGIPVEKGVNAGCVTSNNRVTFPVFVESSISVANIALASCFWLLSPDDTEEIDIIENYGGVDYWKQFTHISHHSFVRSPFHDYQPKDWESWWPDPRVNSTNGWGSWCWNNGNRRYLRMGVFWVSPEHFEYYIDGNLVRVMYENAIATKYNGTWVYTYYDALHPNGTKDQWGNNLGGIPKTDGGAHNGYSNVTQHSSSSTFDFAKLQAASNASNGISVVDPGWYQGGDTNTGAKGFTKELDIIINLEAQSWLVNHDTPTNTELTDAAKNQMKIDWVRVYKPVVDEGGSEDIAVTDITATPATLSIKVGETGNISGAVIPSNATIKTMTFTSDKDAIATVTQSGVVTAKSEGTAIITLKSTDGGHTTTCTVTVTNDDGNNDDALILEDELVIEAEDFIATRGTTNDAEWGGPGLGVGKEATFINWVNGGDWAEYKVNVVSAGTFDLSYKIATPGTNTQIQFLSNNTALATDNVSQTGSTWKTAAFTTQNSGSSIELAAGVQTIKILASNAEVWQWNLDNITLKRASSSIVEKTKTDLIIYPNPFVDEIYIKTTKELETVSIYQINGTLVKTVNSAKNIISVQELDHGIYIVMIQTKNGEWVTRKLTKL